MCGAGRGDDYSKDDGFSHDANDIVALMDALVIPIFHPDTKKEMRQYMRDFIKKPKPAFLSLTR